MPWRSSAYQPCNFISRHKYQGINPLVLAMQGYASPYWLTFNQCRSIGGRINKGEHATPVVFWNFSKKEVISPSGIAESKVIPFLKVYQVFNVEQTTGITYANPEVPVNPFTPIESASMIVDQWIDKPEIKHADHFNACYTPALDEIHMPMQTSFINPEYYYSTLFHELIHSTGHKSRLDRLSNLHEDRNIEELIAEIGSSWLAIESGISTQSLINNTVAYCQSWSQRLKDKPAMIISCASKAQKAVNMILNISSEKGNSEDKEIIDTPIEHVA